MFACKSARVYFLRKFWVTDVPCLQHNVKLLELHKQKHAMRYGCARCPLSFSGGEESLIQVSAIFQVLVIAFKASPHYFFKQSTLCFLSKRLKAQLLCLDAPTFFPLYFLLIKKQINMEELIMVASTEHLLVPLSHVKGKDATRCAESGMAHHMLGDVLCIGLKSVPM